MSYENEYLKQYRQLSNPNSQYYGRANEAIRNNLNSAGSTVNSLLGMQMAMGGSYKGSLEAAKKQRKALETRNAESANQGTNQLYLNSQGQANQALGGAQAAYEYEDSQPGFWDYIAGPLSTVAGSIAGGGIGGLLGGVSGSGMTGGRRPAQGAMSWQQRNNAMSNVGSRLPVGYRNVPEYDPLNY